MNHWLMKTEPEEFSIDELAARKREPWTGVRNYQVRNLMRDAMRRGDRVLVYHSSCAVPGVYGLGRIDGAAYPDPTQFDPRSDYHDPKSPREAPRWLAVDVAFQRRFRAPVTLAAMRQEPALADMLVLQRGNRLSITPVEARHYARIVGMEPAR